MKLNQWNTMGQKWFLVAIILQKKYLTFLIFPLTMDQYSVI